VPLPSILLPGPTRSRTRAFQSPGMFAVRPSASHESIRRSAKLTRFMRKQTGEWSDWKCRVKKTTVIFTAYRLWQSRWIGHPDVFARDPYQSPRNVHWVFAPLQHPRQPVECRLEASSSQFRIELYRKCMIGCDCGIGLEYLWITAANALVKSRNCVVVLIPRLVVLQRRLLDGPPDVIHDNDNLGRPAAPHRRRV
jgi:hypothetical protein